MDVKIIAEIGINHNGSIQIAKDLATVAKSAGCDFVKLQKREIDLCYTPEELAAPCESPWGSTRREYLEGRELTWDEVEEFANHCSRIGIKWSASCFDIASFRELNRRFGREIPWYKIPSGMAVAGREAYQREVADAGGLVLISTGLCESKDIERIGRLFGLRACEYVLMHCVALYPCPPDRLNLSVITGLLNEYVIGSKSRFCIGIGYSGHETGVLPSVVAAGLGATWIERHITLDRAMYGSDQAASLEPSGLNRLVRDIRSLGTILGDGKKRLHGDEKNPIKHYVESPYG